MIFLYFPVNLQRPVQYSPESDPEDPLLDVLWDFIKNSKPTEINGSGSNTQTYGSTDPDPLNIFTDPEHCSFHSPFLIQNFVRVVSTTFFQICWTLEPMSGERVGGGG